MRKIEPVERPDIGLRLFVFCSALPACLSALSGLLPGCQQLFPGVGHKPAVGRAEAGLLLLLCLPRHPGKQGRMPFGKHRLGKRKDIVFAVLVQHGVSELAVMPGAFLRAERNIIQEALGPAKIPAVVKAQAVIPHVSRGHRPFGGAVRDQHHIRECFPEGLRQLPDKIHSFQILPAAVHVVISVSEIQNGRHVHDAEAVDMVSLRPEQKACREEIVHLRAAEAEHRGISAAGRLIELCPVKFRQAEAVLREPCPGPVQDHTDPLPVQKINERHKLLRRSEAGCGRVIPGRLIAQGLVQRMLRQRHQRNVGIIHAFCILCQHGRSGNIVRGLSFRQMFPKPGAEMQLAEVEGMGRAEGTLLFPERHPRAVLPRIPGEIRRHRGCLRPELSCEGAGISLQEHSPVRSLDLIFVDRTGGKSGDKDLEYAGIPEAAHLVASSVPVVEISHHRNPQGVGRPHGKTDAGDAGDHVRMRSEELPDPDMVSRSKFLKVFLLPCGNEGIRILDLLDSIVRAPDPEPVGDPSGIPDQTCKKAVLVLPVHFHCLSGVRQDCFHPQRMRNKRLDQKSLRDYVRSQHRMRIRGFGIDDFFHCCPVHQIIQLPVHSLTSRNIFSEILGLPDSESLLKEKGACASSPKVINCTHCSPSEKDGRPRALCWEFPRCARKTRIEEFHA